MSEFQYYEFRTVNRTLTKEEVKEVNTWSSRGNVTPTSAIFEYNYGSFKQKPKDCLRSHFDLMLHYANFGCKRMMFRLPKSVVNFQNLMQFEYNHPEIDYEHSILISENKDFIIVDIEENKEEGYEEWIECEGTLAAVMPLWTDIMNGDFRSLYLVWSSFSHKAIENKILSEGDDLKYPPVPSGLKNISASLTEFNIFWDIDDDFIKELAKQSPDKIYRSVDYKKAIGFLSDNEKSDFLLRFAQNEEHVLQKFLKRLDKLQ
jgi:hypothetical protein